MGKALARKQWIRDLASRVSPNSVLVLAIAVFLAGLPENRVRKISSSRQRKRRQQKTEEAAKVAETREQKYGDKMTTEVIYNDDITDPYDDDVENEDIPYIGRGPTPRGVYEIVEGDTLCSIAGCFNLALVEIIDKNGDVIVNPDELSPGDRIRIF
jgi:hypothetical protein